MRSVCKRTGAARHRLARVALLLAGLGTVSPPRAPAQDVKTVTNIHGFIRAAAVTPDGGTLITTYQSARVVRLHDLGSAKEREVIQIGQGPNLAVAVRKRMLAVAGCWPARGDGSDPAPFGVRIYGLSPTVPSATLVGHEADVSAVSFSPDGALLATGDVKGNIRLWDVAERRCLRAWSSHVDAVAALVFSPDGSRIAGGGAEKEVFIFDIASGKRLAWLDNYHAQILALAFSNDGKRLSAGGMGNTLVTWDLASLKVVREVTLENAKGQSIASFAFSADALLACAGTEHGLVKIWNAETGSERATLIHGDLRNVRCLVFSPDSNTLVSGAEDESNLLEAVSEVRIWDLSRMLRDASK